MTRFYLLPILFFTLPTIAQSLTPQVITTASSYLTGSNGSLSFTIGETAVGDYSSGSGSLTQGFQPTVDASSPLPLDFLSFAAKLVNGKTQLDWTTTHEIDTDHFLVERSTDGTTFDPIAEVPALNPANPDLDNTYEAIDSQPLPGMDYYRITEIDQNGNANYSPIVSVKINNGLSCMVYPNPTADRAYIRINSRSAAQATIIVCDLRGQVISSRSISLTPGENEFELNLANKAKGIYMIKILGLEGLPSYSILKN